MISRALKKKMYIKSWISSLFESVLVSSGELRFMSQWYVRYSHVVMYSLRQPSDEECHTAPAARRAGPAPSVRPTKDSSDLIADAQFEDHNVDSG